MLVLFLSIVTIMKLNLKMMTVKIMMVTIRN